ncbi:MAG: hypothetical protein K5877_04100 [Lachnospiraceae bacterium]|nr:hypothetical protein [Lachnospiraceae bacterium]
MIREINEDEFGFTRENAPRFVAFATDEERLKFLNMCSTGQCTDSLMMKSIG